jgi:hypothetical protein
MDTLPSDLWLDIATRLPAARDVAALACTCHQASELLGSPEGAGHVCRTYRANPFARFICVRGRPRFAWIRAL